jgi:hypothetical protein
MTKPLPKHLLKYCPHDVRKLKIEAEVLALWGTASITEIARRVGSNNWTVNRIAVDNGLPPTIKGSTAAPVLKPWPRPRGRSSDEIAWARENPDHPEAGMVLLMHEHPDPAAGHRSWAV